MTPGKSVLSKRQDKVDWNGRYETPAGKARLGETPQAKAEEAPTARGKRVPRVEINVQIVQAIKNRQTRFSSSLSTV